MITLLQGAPMKTRIDPPTEIAKDATPREACKYVVALVQYIGPGFHPDTRFRDYVHRHTGEPSLTPSQARALQKGLNRAWSILDRAGIEIYRVGLVTQRRMLLSR
jgi:hypothetical protein